MLITTVLAVLGRGVPQAATMGIVGLIAPLANGSVALMLYRYRSGDANMRSVWICSRNDAIGNLADLLAAAGVVGTGTAWPDLTVVLIMGALGNGVVYRLSVKCAKSYRQGPQVNVRHNNSLASTGLGGVSVEDCGNERVLSEAVPARREAPPVSPEISR